ncbi:MAG TPA: phospholipase D-like domain-containing protein [Pyrinomonadaceae bacterium]|nr:phospholipase D-like domain-containing protein [Pyrinomonadaceae bacterium]
MTVKISHKIHNSATKDGLTAKVYRGDGAAMLAFNLDEKLTKDLAGFAVKRTAPDGKSAYLNNRLHFTSSVTSDTKMEEIGGHPTNEAPLQKFRWMDFPEEMMPGDYRYDVTAMLFDKGGQLKEGPTVRVDLEIEPKKIGDFEFGFTRGYLSSQAYTNLFKNAPIRPPKKSLDYKTKAYAKQYEWLGYHARKMVFDFVEECLKDKRITVDLFAYDLDEPDFVRAMQKMGKRLRAYLDNAPLHTKAGALEIDAHKALVKSAGAKNVKQGHFHRFAHKKILIQKRDGKPVKVLTGSANFSVRGLYVQANNILVIEDPQTAALYDAAFEQSFNAPDKFATSEIAEGWHEIEADGLPKFAVAFSPHKSADVSLKRVADAISAAQSSVIFAVMELAGGGTVMDELKALPDKKKMFSYGMTQTMGGIKVYKPGESSGMIVPFEFLKGKVPPPFQDEYSGGSGIVIHDKFVVVDFNGANPAVFTGSSNLAAGGEEANGDNLLAIYDPAVAAAYAVEAVRLVDHYHFRATMKTADASNPLCLQGPDAKDKWWQPYYDPKTIFYHERTLFSS